MADTAKRSCGTQTRERRQRGADDARPTSGASRRRLLGADTANKFADLASRRSLE